MARITASVYTLHVPATGAALAATLVAAAVFAVLALRGTGLGFVMIIAAIAQIVWGVAYRWTSITSGATTASLSVRVRARSAKR
jgi:branched-chain amino acid transport system permease protein